MTTFAFRPIIVDQEDDGIGVFKQPALQIYDGDVLYPTATGYARAAAAQVGNDLVFSQMNMAATDTRKVAVTPVAYDILMTVTLSGVATIGNTAPGTKYALGLDATTNVYFANSAVSTTPFFEIVEFAQNDLGGYIGDTNVRVRARVTPLV